MTKINANQIRGIDGLSTCIGNITTIITPVQHETLRQLIHFIDNGPADGFVSGAYREITYTNNIFPSSIIWYEDYTKGKKIVEKLTMWTGVVPTTITWNVYDENGVTIVHTVIDSIAYINNIFETSRTRAII